MARATADATTERRAGGVAADPETRIEGVARGERAVTVRWGDGHVSSFHYLWLRYACSCERCGDAYSGVGDIRLTYYPPDLVAEEAYVTDTGRLAVRWGAGNTNCVGSLFEPQWLRAHCYSESERRRRRERVRPILWDSTASGSLPEISYAEALSGDDGQYRLLKAVHRYGVARVRHGPPSEEGLSAVAGLVGHMIDSHFGKIMDIITKPEVQIVTDRPDHISLHTDNCYRHTPTGIHFFQGVTVAPEGGQTILGDGFMMAEALRAEDPDAFDLLSRVPQTFQRYIPGRIAQFTQAPSISVDFEGNVTGLRYANRVTAGPLSLPEDLVEPVYRAQRKLVEKMDDPRFEVCFLVEPGEVLVFDNHRVLHGRKAFGETGGRRHLRRCHVEREEFHSRLRLLAEKVGEPLPETPLPRGAL